jgi:hypothetical protein
MAKKISDYLTKDQVTELYEMDHLQKKLTSDEIANKYDIPAKIARVVIALGAKKKIESNGVGASHPSRQRKLKKQVIDIFNDAKNDGKGVSELAKENGIPLRMMYKFNPFKSKRKSSSEISIEQPSLPKINSKIKPVKRAYVRRQLPKSTEGPVLAMSETEKDKLLISLLFEENKRLKGVK